MKINDNSLSKKPFRGRPVSSFIPTNHEESRCKEIAIELEEPYIDYLLSILSRNGYSVIERAWGLYKETRASGQTVRNPPAYFNGIITKLISPLWMKYHQNKWKPTEPMVRKAE